MTVKQLNYDELLQLKCDLWYETDNLPSMTDEDYEICINAGCPDDIPDELVYRLYDGTDFVEDDFWCNIDKKNTNNIGLCTFPHDDKDYCIYFEVPKDWLTNWIKETNEYSNIEYFLENYTWDETWYIYINAIEVNKLLVEEAVA